MFVGLVWEERVLVYQLHSRALGFKVNPSIMVRANPNPNPNLHNYLRGVGIGVFVESVWDERVLVH